MDTTPNRFAIAVLALGGLCVGGFAQVKAGDPAPGFSVMSMSGSQTFLKDMQNQGSIFLYFVRDQDAVSSQETTYINRIAAAYKSSRSTWYGITNARDDRARSFIAEFKPPFQFYRDEDLSAVKAFTIQAAPAVVQIDKNGMILNVWRGLSVKSLKEINRAASIVNRRPLKDVDFANAPTTTQYGIDFNKVTGGG